MKYRVFSHIVHIASKLRGLDRLQDQRYIQRRLKVTGTYKGKTLIKYTRIDFIYIHFNPVLASHITILNSSFIYSYTLMS